MLSFTTFLAFMIQTLQLSQSETCIPYECVSFQTNICARKSLNTIMINENPCDDGYLCLASDVQALNSDDSQESLPCVEKASDKDYQWDKTFYKCGNRKNDRDFVNLNSDKTCESEDDCILKDGNKMPCVCGADGKKYCIPAWDSIAFDEYWNECDEGLSHSQLEYWTLFKGYYSIWISSEELPCVASTILEINTAKSINLYSDSFGIFLIMIYGYAFI